ncbi:MAG: CocE/NonD family hydrolase [bacterium]
MELGGQLRQMFELRDHPLRFVGEAAALPGLIRLAFETAQGEAVRGFLCRPETVEDVPAILVIHAHGNKYDIGAQELISGRPALQDPLGAVLAARGIASLCLDLPCFGSRAGVTESAATKAALWRGKSLAGQMLGECASALDWLASREGIRADRIGVFGISMGATLGYWLASVDERVRVLAHECCLADFAALIATGAHDLHGIYLTVPGLLEVASNGVIAGMMAPRAQFIGIGDTDPLTPPEAVNIALTEVRAAYRAGGRLEVHREPESGHVETLAMRAAMLGFLVRELM